MGYLPTPPAGGSAPSRGSVMSAVRAAQAVVPAASDTERASVVTNWATATGAAVSATNPVYIYRTDLKRFEVSTNGTTWWSYRLQSGGVFTGSTSATGEILIPHGLGATPAYVSLTPVHDGNDAIARIARPVLASKNATNIRVLVARTDTSNWLTSNPVTIEWTATL